MLGFILLDWLFHFLYDFLLTEEDCCVARLFARVPLHLYHGVEYCRVRALARCSRHDCTWILAWRWKHRLGNCPRWALLSLNSRSSCWVRGPARFSPGCWTYRIETFWHSCSWPWKWKHWAEISTRRCTRLSAAAHTRFLGPTTLFLFLLLFFCFNHWKIRRKKKIPRNSGSFRRWHCVGAYP